MSESGCFHLKQAGRELQFSVLNADMGTVNALVAGKVEWNAVGFAFTEDGM